MAFSMFARSSACTNRVFGQQLMRFATQSALAHRNAASALCVKSLAAKESKTPILDSVRSFRTSSVALSAEKPHDHSKLWVIEKATSAALVPLIPLGLLMPNKLFDSLLAILITAHSFWGLEAIAVDYVRASIFGPLIPKLAIALVWLVSIATLGGLFYVITHDVGICNAVRQLWAVRSGNKA
ncbi:succinate dehydrogenase [ubiquinone] cytochrome b small subunit, mitochondrial [Ostrinia nubilalis]|uniref:succinate dehydrogenase [ubiquinone] cytochrome b small subunit, mitochondrial n=1 Tax=Ostrinia nubilalis TaxID=29057 RepID=UPI0030823979